MKSKTNHNFWICFNALPLEIQKLARKNFLVWQNNSRHPSLRFRPHSNGRWSVRIGDHYRAIGYVAEDGTLVWTWIGSHENYNKL